MSTLLRMLILVVQKLTTVHSKVTARCEILFKFVYSQLISSTSLIPTLLHNLFNVTIRVHKLCSLLFTVLFPVCFDHFATIILGISGDYRKHLHTKF
jgi:hypothetical protein